MNADDLTPDQAEVLSRGLFRGLNFLFRLQSRMEKAGFPPNDPLFQLVNKAYEATHRLSVDLHYRSCGTGVGRETKRPDT